MGDLFATSHRDEVTSTVAASLIAELVSPRVASVEVFGDRAAGLFAEEEMALRGSAPGRRREFITGRYCARKALGRLGVGPTPLLSGLRRGPRWPEGIVGSITHCAEFRAAAVARAEHVATMGIDAEPNEPLPPGVLDLVARPAEAAMLERLDPAAGICWDRLLFSAKEALYKAWHPVMRCSLGFEDAVVTISATAPAFRARLNEPLRLKSAGDVYIICGRWGVSQGVIATAIELPFDDAGCPTYLAGPCT
jgi:4'-phosphopantetheinyl transferase EntD